MKKLLLLILTFSLVACSGGDDDNNGSNSSSQSDILSVAGNDYELDGGRLQNFGPGLNAVNIDLDLYSAGITPQCEANGWSGLGHDIYFEMWTSQEGFLDSGTYQINEDYSVFNITYADYALNVDLGVDDWDEVDWVSIASGTVNVERSGNNYTISWDTIDTNGNVVVGSYSGSLSYCDAN